MTSERKKTYGVEWLLGHRAETDIRSQGVDVI